MAMPMHMPAHMTWPAAGIAWAELAVFWILVALAAAWLLRPPGLRRPRTMPLRGRLWRWPETSLVALGLPLELLWEIAQFPLYDVWHERGWGTILYALVHCTLGDLLILLVAYGAVALLLRNRAWALGPAAWRGALPFTLLGAAYTVYSEIVNVRVEGNWGYTELMPRVPVLEIGAMPLLQWLLIPPILLWLMRLTGPRVAAG